MTRTKKEMELERENARLLLLYQRWRSIGTTYLVTCEKGGLGSKAASLLTDEERHLIKQEYEILLQKFS